MRRMPTLSPSDLQCRNARPNAKLVKFSDGGGLQLRVTPDAAKLWRLACRIEAGEAPLDRQGAPATDAIAQTFIDVWGQERSAWTFEIGLGRWVEAFQDPTPDFTPTEAALCIFEIDDWRNRAPTSSFKRLD
jgi:hypothetical protein